MPDFLIFLGVFRSLHTLSDLFSAFIEYFIPFYCHFMCWIYVIVVFFLVVIRILKLVMTSTKFLTLQVVFLTCDLGHLETSHTCFDFLL